MSDWRETGSDLQAEWLRRSEAARSSYARHRRALASEMPMLAAVVAHNRGEKSAIQQLLRTPGYRPSPDDLETLAHFLDGGFAKPTKGAGQPKGNDRWVAAEAQRFFEEWKELNRTVGVKDWGHRDHMRQAAIEFVIQAYLPPSMEVDAANVAEIMRRGKSRQN